MENLQSAKILVVDDEETLCKTIQAYLQQEGYQVQLAHDGVTALKMARSFQPHLLILDIMLPALSGLEVLRQLRLESVVYVLLLTAKADEVDKVVGLTLGADDYLTKPFSPRELVARVQAILRRSRSTTVGEASLGTRRLRIDTAARQVWKDDQTVELTPSEYSLLAALARHAGRVLSREQLIEQVWGYDYYGDDRVIDVHIRRLRHKIEDDPTQPAYVVTVRSVGYRFDGEAV
ncbi:MAG: response regulator transcription factor [Caldilineaceae bacterium]